MSLCTAVKKDGTQCHARAVRADPDGRCLFHSSLNFSGARRAGREVTAEELVRTLGAEIRRLQKDRSLPAISRADAIRNLIVLWREMSTPQVKSLPKGPTLEEKLKMLEKEGLK